MQPSTDDGAHRFLRLLDRQIHLLQFLNRDRAYLIAEMNPASIKQLPWPDRNAEAPDLFVFMLEAQQKTDKYYGEYPDADFSKDELWRIRNNRGVNSQGKLREYAEKHGIKYNMLRDMVSVSQKGRAIESALGIPGLSKALFPISKQLKELKFDQIEPFCTLLLQSDSLETLRYYAPIALGLWDNYAVVRSA